MERRIRGQEMGHKVKALIAVLILSTAALGQSGPSLRETFEWITNTLQPSEGNNSVTHRPFDRPYTKDWQDRGIDPFHAETLSKISHNNCQVKIDVDTVDNDMVFEIGRVFSSHYINTFNLRDIDPASIHIDNACAPIESPNGPAEPWNCRDEQGKFIIFKTANLVPKIHEEVTTSAGKSMFGFHQSKWDKEEVTWEGMCKSFPKPVEAYCDFNDKKDAPKDLTSLQLGFGSEQYAKRFVSAFRHAVELCGGKVSAF
jgi:hypothetical protein